MGKGGMMAFVFEDEQQAPKSGRFVFEDEQSTPATEMQEAGGFMQGVGNLAAGAVRGASNIGATILNPLDSEARAQRKATIEQQLKEWGADPESALYKTGEIGTEIAGTAGIGGALGKGAQALHAAPAIVNALRAGGFAKDAGLLTNIGAGALAGAGSAYLTGGDAGTGAMLGGALPAGAAAVKTLTPAVLGMTSGAGGEAVKQAFMAGKKGGATAKAFTQNMRGDVAADDVLNVARANLAEMGAQKSAAYRQGMAQVSGDKTVLAFDGVDKAMKDAYNVATFKGQVKNVAAAKKLQEVYDAISRWKQLNPAEYHTPEGMDALKQNIGGILETIPFEEKTARHAVGGIFNSIKTEINKQAPTYAKVMKDFSDASETITEIERALSLGKKASADTSMRKLQSLMRNNVNTNYGNRTALARELEQQGGREIMPAIAGQALNTWTPRGLQSASTVPTSLLAYGVGGAPMAAAGLMAGSPRLVGESAYATGRLADLLNRVPQSKNALAALRQGAIIEGSK